TYKNGMKSSKLFTQIKNLSTPRPSKKQWIVFAISLASLLILVNIVLIVYHQSHFYPITQFVSVHFGGFIYYRATTIVHEPLQLQTVRLAFDQDVKPLSPSELGANYDVDASLKAAQAIASPLSPLLAYTPWGDKPQVDFEYNLDETVFSKKVSE